MPIDYANNEKIAGIASLTLQTFPTANTQALDVVDGAGNLYSVNCLNPNAAQIILRFYDMRAADVNIALAASKLPAPICRHVIPAAGTALAGEKLIRGLDLPWHYNNALSVRATAGFADTDTTNIAASPVLELDFSANRAYQALTAR